jgi:8-oxo-dGTP diphosphatase
VSKVELAAAVVVMDDHVLIVRRSRKESFLPRQWGVPCGKIDVKKGEDSQQAVLRELEEETGLSGSVICWVGQSEFQSIWHGEQVINVQHNFLVAPLIGPVTKLDCAGRPKIKTPRWDQKARWVRTDDLDGVGLDRHNLETIRQGLDADVAMPGRSAR